MSQQAFSSNTNEFQAICIGDSHIIVTDVTSTQSPAVAQQTSIIRLFCTKDCFIAIGQDPVATTSSMFLPGGIIEYYGSNPGDKVAVLQVSISGILYMTEGR